MNPTSFRSKRNRKLAKYVHSRLYVISYMFETMYHVQSELINSKLSVDCIYHEFTYDGADRTTDLISFDMDRVVVML